MKRSGAQEVVFVVPDQIKDKPWFWTAQWVQDVFDKYEVKVRLEEVSISY